MMRTSAFTLVELVVVLLLLSTVAIAVGAPPLSTTHETQLEVARSEVINALRFARREAMRTHSDCAVRIDNSAHSLSVFFPVLASGEIVVGTAAQHPLTKKAYALQLADLGGEGGVEFNTATAPFQFLGLTGSRGELIFDPRGTPSHLEGGLRRQLSSGEVQLSYRGQSRSISVSPIGRVVPL